MNIIIYFSVGLTVCPDFDSHKNKRLYKVRSGANKFIFSKQIPDYILGFLTSEFFKKFINSGQNRIFI